MSVNEEEGSNLTFWPYGYCLFHCIIPQHHSSWISISGSELTIMWKIRKNIQRYLWDSKKKNKITKLFCPSQESLFFYDSSRTKSKKLEAKCCLWSVHFHKQHHTSTHTENEDSQCHDSSSCTFLFLSHILISRVLPLLDEKDNSLYEKQQQIPNL